MYYKNQVVPVNFFSLNFLRHYWITMRPYLLFVSGITGIVGLSFTPSLSIIATAVLFLTFFLSYGFGQALTDCFQIDTDTLSSPYRPLTQGRINKKDVLTVSDAPVTLADISKTVLDTLNIPAQVAGKSVFKVKNTDQRTRRYMYYSGFKKWRGYYMGDIEEYLVTGFSWSIHSWQKSGRIFPPKLK